ncbi:hypothetical protein EW145_g6837, partial [Phellinidium pouzarii]
MISTTCVWDDGEISFDMVMQTDNGAIDEESKFYTLTQYRRLLEQAHGASAAQLHALQAELRTLRIALEDERAAACDVEMQHGHMQMQRRTAPHALEDIDLAAALCGDGHRIFNEAEVRKAVPIILESCLPGDIRTQIGMLENYLKSTFDIVGNLSPELSFKILRYLSVNELVGIESVPKKWQSIVHSPALWRYHCLLLTATDPVSLRPSCSPEGWEPLYHSLHHREANFHYGLPQTLRLLNTARCAHGAADQWAYLWTRVSASPYDISLHAQLIQLALASGMDNQVTAARQLLLRFWSAGEEVWLPTIEARIHQGVDTLGDVLDVLALFQTAEEDYLSIQLLKLHLEFVIERHSFLNALESKSEDLGDVFSDAWTRSLLSPIIEKGSGHLTKSHLLWDIYMNWELEQLERTQGEERSKRILEIEGMFMTRLTQPHSNHDETFQSYSTFTTTYKPSNDYETLAISDAARMRFEGSEIAEVALRSFWEGYCDVLRTSNDDVDQQKTVLQRAARSVPGSGVIWAKHIRYLESTESNVEALMHSVSEIYDMALSSGLIQKDVEAIVSLVLARAGLIKRAIASNGEVEANAVVLFQVLEDGIAMVRAASRQGDPRYRLEKFLADICVTLAESPDDASVVWETTAKHYKSSYLAWVLYTEALVKQEKHDEVRAVYKNIVSRNFDWPEAIFDAWVAFEHLYGNLNELQESLDRTERAQNQINLKRAKEAEKAAAFHNDPAVALISEARKDTFNTTSPVNDGEFAADNQKKRKSDDSESKSTTNKKFKTESAVSIKRDRENSTVFVADLPPTVTEKDLISIFKDCGSIRETKITKLSNSHVATVEFSDSESVPGGLTKDKKRIGEQEISVHLAWQSTLYVTNFVEKTDDAYIRQLFGQVMRTDAGANDREVYIAGLSRFVTKKDLETLFKTYGVIKEVRMATDEASHSKGFAFVEFEDEPSAQRALQANNYDLKNRRISVTLADARVRARLKNEQAASGLGRRADLRSRSVRIKGLPSATQEGLLQQALEKITPLKRVEVFQDTGEAVVELESAADAGRLLLLSEPLHFGGQILTISEELLESAPTGVVLPRTGGGMFIPRAAASRPQAGLGRVKVAVQKSPTLQEKESAVDGKWVREGLFKFSFELRNLSKNILFNMKEASDHSFSWKTANWGWAQFARREAVYYQSNSVRNNDALLITCIISSSPAVPSVPSLVPHCSVPRELLDVVGSLLDDPVYSDIVFVLPIRASNGGMRNIYAARSILKRVEYFKSMFDSGFSESSSQTVEMSSETLSVSNGSDTPIISHQFEDSDVEDEEESADVNGETEDQCNAIAKSSNNTDAASSDNPLIPLAVDSLDANVSDNDYCGSDNLGERNVRPKLSHPSSSCYNGGMVMDTDECSIGPARGSSTTDIPIEIGPRKTKIIVKDISYATYRAVLYYLYTDSIVFAPLASSFLAPSPVGPPASAHSLSLRSQGEGQNLNPSSGSRLQTEHNALGPTTRKAWIADWECQNQGRAKPCSAKAVYRVAD